MVVRPSSPTFILYSWLLFAWSCLGQLVSYCLPVGTIHRHFRTFIFRVVRCGPIPRHIAFIMDGNRRYAVAAGLPSKLEGHQHGFRKLQEILQWSLELGVRSITVYAFSIENFRRPLEEVNCLMSLAKAKFRQLSEHTDIITKYSVTIRVLGQLEMLPEDVRQVVEQAMQQTRRQSNCGDDETGFTLNICSPYTSTAELLTISNRLLCCEGEKQKEKMITVDAINRLIYTNPGPPLDLLVRTSGEWRLSEFLTWQATAGGASDLIESNDDDMPGTKSGSPHIAFVNTLWPSLGLYQFIFLLLRYQVAERRQSYNKNFA